MRQTLVRSSKPLASHAPGIRQERVSFVRFRIELEKICVESIVDRIVDVTTQNNQPIRLSPTIEGLAVIISHPPSARRASQPTANVPALFRPNYMNKPLNTAIGVPPFYSEL
jgi:hypothetical protein